ncbi:hypothetical protein PGT21_019380 [Puccinia graminis f. sp. tritici]|uniref:Uncharacterized protein n=1 Tax=Puccinia graminis f. sp. tritici TaxID=56615 RepID=A0A5B0ML41_PUCGR|nr:hypothetical protein PGT21_019380 [Puccinia graminis f. sp. tritici]
MVRCFRAINADRKAEKQYQEILRDSIGLLHHCRVGVARRQRMNDIPEPKK